MKIDCKHIIRTLGVRNSVKQQFGKWPFYDDKSLDFSYLKLINWLQETVTPTELHDIEWNYGGDEGLIQFLVYYLHLRDYLKI